MELTDKQKADHARVTEMMEIVMSSEFSDEAKDFFTQSFLTNPIGLEAIKIMRAKDKPLNDEQMEFLLNALETLIATKAKDAN